MIQYDAFMSVLSNRSSLDYEEIVSVTRAMDALSRSGILHLSEISDAMMHLGQSLLLGKFQGEDFRCMAANSPMVVDLLAEALNVTRRELNSMSHQGKITSDMLAHGLLHGSRMVLATEVQDSDGKWHSA